MGNMTLSSLQEIIRETFEEESFVILNLKIVKEIEVNMSQVSNFLFRQYSDYNSLDISMEIIAVTLGLVSVVYAKNSVLLYPTGMVSTGILSIYC